MRITLKLESCVLAAAKARARATQRSLSAVVEDALLAPGLAHIPWRQAMVDSIQYLRHPVRPRTPAEIEASWIEAIDRTTASGGTTTVVIHAFVSGVDDARFAAVRKVLTHARRRGDIEILTAGALAGRVLSSPA